MEEALQLMIEMNEWTWNQFRGDLKDVTPEEINWRPLPHANSINLILRHLRIEAEWHLASLEHGEPMPVGVSVNLQQEIDSVPLDFERNLKELEEFYTGFVAALRKTTLAALQRQTVLVYKDFPGDPSLPANFLGFHQAVHLATHWGQIRTVRNLYRKTRGETGAVLPGQPHIPHIVEPPHNRMKSPKADRALAALVDSPLNNPGLGAIPFT